MHTTAGLKLYVVEAGAVQSIFKTLSSMCQLPPQSPHRMHPTNDNKTRQGFIFVQADITLLLNKSTQVENVSL